MRRMKHDGHNVQFFINGLWFEYDEEKNRININKHGLSLKMAARVFFDYNRIEFYDEAHSLDEDRFDTIGDIRSGGIAIGKPASQGADDSDIVFVVYTERKHRIQDDQPVDVIRIISARMANSFERGVYYGNQNGY